MERRYKVVIEQDEDGVYFATVPALPGVVEQGDTVDEAFQNMGAARTSPSTPWSKRERTFRPPTRLPAPEWYAT